MLSHLALANRAMCYVYIVKCVSYNTYIVRAQPQTLLPYTFPIGVSNNIFCYFSQFQNNQQQINSGQVFRFIKYKIKTGRNKKTIMSYLFS